MIEKGLNSEEEPEGGLAEIIHLFSVEAEKNGAIVHRVKGWTETLPLIAEIVSTLETGGIFAAPNLAGIRRRQLQRHLQHMAFPLRVGDLRPHAGEISIGLTMASAGIAATGTLVSVDTDEDVRLASMLGVIHIALVRADTLVPALGDISSFLEQTFTEGPGFVAMISGPSRTADIERSLTIGVHGPHTLHIVILEEES